MGVESICLGIEAAKKGTSETQFATLIEGTNQCIIRKENI